MGRQHAPHDLPVAEGAVTVPLGQLLGVVAADETRLVGRAKVGIVDLVDRHQELAAGLAVEQVSGGGSAEGDGGGAAGAEDDDVGEVGVVLCQEDVARMLPEDAAGRKDGADGMDDGLDGRQGKVAGVVLDWLEGLLDDFDK